MTHPRLALLLTAVALAPACAWAQPAAPKREVVYDIRALAGKRDLTKAGHVVKTLLSVIEIADIEVLNASRLVIRATDKEHAQVAQVIKALLRADDIAVFVRADLHEVDDAFYTRLMKVRPVDPEEVERQFFAGKAPRSELWPIIDKQKPVLAGEEIQLANGGAGTLLARHRVVTFLPSPEQVNQDDKSRQLFLEGVAVEAAVQVTRDRRYVRVRLAEKGTATPDSYKTKVFDPADREVEAEVVFPRESTHARLVEVADGGSILVPVAYRPVAAQKAGRRWVVALTARIYIREEEEALRGKDQ